MCISLWSKMPKFGSTTPISHAQYNGKRFISIPHREVFVCRQKMTGCLTVHPRSLRKYRKRTSVFITLLSGITMEEKTMHWTNSQLFFPTSLSWKGPSLSCLSAVEARRSGLTLSRSDSRFLRLLIILEYEFRPLILLEYEVRPAYYLAQAMDTAHDFQQILASAV